MIEWHTERNKHHQVTNNIEYCHQAKKISTALWVSRRTGSPVDVEPWSSVCLPSCLFVTTHCAASVVILRAPESVGWTLRFWRRASTTRALVHSTKQDNHIKSHPIYLVTIAFVLYVCMHVCVYACMDVRMPIHNVHMSVCTYVWVYVCMYDAACNPPKYSFLGGGGGFIPATDAGIKDPSFPSLGREWGLADSIAQLSYACLMAFKIHAHHNCGIGWVLPIVSDIGQWTPNMNRFQQSPRCALDPDGCYSTCGFIFSSKQRDTWRAEQAQFWKWDKRPWAQLCSCVLFLYMLQSSNPSMTWSVFDCFGCCSSISCVCCHVLMCFMWIKLFLLFCFRKLLLSTKNDYLGRFGPGNCVFATPIDRFREGDYGTYQR